LIPVFITFSNYYKKCSQKCILAIPYLYWFYKDFKNLRKCCGEIFAVFKNKHILCRWAVSFAGWRRTERTSEDRKAQQTAKDGYFAQYYLRNETVPEMPLTAKVNKDKLLKNKSKRQETFDNT
jgi:hypothetical protein